MKISPSRQSVSQRRTEARPAKTPSAEAESPDQLVLVYSANNVSSLGNKPKPVAGSFKLMPDLKELAKKTDGSNVTIVAQGYEKLETGEWVTRRYRMEKGELKDETSQIDGYRTLYDDEYPANYQGRVPDRGERVSMFSREAVQDFMLDAMRPYPSARRTTLFLNAHGSPTPNFGGEAIIDKQWQHIRHEEITVKEFGHALQAVEEKTGNRLDLLDVNTCEMGKVENYLELGEHADLMIASPQNEFVPKGHEYTAAFQDIVGASEHLIADSKSTPRDLGEKIIELTTEKTTFVEDGVTENPIPTLELVDTAKLNDVAESLDKAGRKMSAMLREPESRKRVIDSLEGAFGFRESVVDLNGFLRAVDQPETKALVSAIDNSVLVSFAGKFRGRDYSEAGPVAFFAPRFPNEKTPPVLVPKTGDDLRPLVGKTAHSEVPESRLRMWVVKQSGRLNDIHDNVTTRYPAMLEVVPNEGIEKALTRLEKPEKLLQLDQELQKHISFSSKDKATPVQNEITATLAPLEKALEGVDLERWFEDFEAAGGQARLDDIAKEKAVEKAREKALEPVREYQEMDNLPQGWKTFMEDLANAVVDDVWANALVLR